MRDYSPRAYFDASKQDDGTYRFERPAYMDDLIVNHKGHAKYEVNCEDCHGKPSEQAYARPEPLAFMNSCSQCHEERKAPNECATCHKNARQDVKPADHDAAFLRTHGRKAPENWREGEGASCAICHDVPKTCNACHSDTKQSRDDESGYNPKQIHSSQLTLQGSFEIPIPDLFGKLHGSLAAIGDVSPQAFCGKSRSTCLDRGMDPRARPRQTSNLSENGSTATEARLTDFLRPTGPPAVDAKRVIWDNYTFNRQVLRTS